MIRVDAHHHVWTIARGDYGWMSSDLSIARDYGLDDLRPLLGGITATVLVQAADTEAETAFMLDVARASAGLVRGVIGWTLDMGETFTGHADLLQPALRVVRFAFKDNEGTRQFVGHFPPTVF